MNEQLRPLDWEDLDLVRGWRNHPNTRKYMFSQKEISLEEHIEWFNRLLADKTRKLLIYTHFNIPLGFLQFAPIRSNNTVVDWGFYKAPEAERGIGTRMGKLALDYAFDKMNVHKVYGETMDYNICSIKFHLKMGFIQEGILRDHFFDGKKYISVLCFGLMTDEWSLKRNELLEHL